MFEVRVTSIPTVEITTGPQCPPAATGGGGALEAEVISAVGVGAIAAGDVVQAGLDAMKPFILLTPLLLTGCLTNPQQMPILTCTGECTYYGPPQRNPNVEMAEVLTGGVVKLGLGLVNGSVMKSAFNRNSSNTNTIERTTTTNNSVTDRSAVSDVSSSESVSSSTYISDTSSVSDTSVSDVSSSLISTGE